MQAIKSTLFFCLSLLTAQQGFAQDIATYLHGGSSRTWELHYITWFDGDTERSEEFGAGTGDAYTQNEDEATTIPETIVFHSDGTCELYYIAQYEESDSDDDEDLVETGYWQDATWTISGGNVRISESDETDYVWSLTGISGLEDGFACGFDYYGFTSGIEELGYFLE
jgi:hypothetical protein